MNLMFMMLIIMLINLGISFYNARSAGQVWAESKAIGGWLRLLVWCGAIQAAIGFTMVYLIIVSYIAVSVGYISPQLMGVLFNLVYLMIIVPAIGTGIIITIQSWIAVARERSLMNIGTAGWNTFATAYNTYNAIQSFGPALSSVQEGFSGLFDEDSDSDNSTYRVILLAAIVLLAGVVTTSVIIRRYAASLPVSEEVRNAGLRDLSTR